MPVPKYLTNTFVVIGVVVLAAIVIGAALFIKPSRNASQAAQQEPSVAPLTFDGEWVAAEFPLEYHHSYNMQVPSTWDFGAGGDMDHASISIITPPDSNAQVIVVDFALMGCPDSSIDCVYEDIIGISADDFMQRQVAFMETVDTFEPTGTITLPNIAEPVYTYRGTTPSGIARDISLLQLPTGVVLIEFQPAELFGDEVKKNILEGVEGNEE